MKLFTRIIVICAVTALIGVVAWIGVSRSGSSNAASSRAAIIQGINTSAHSIDKADSIWVIVNKHRELSPKTYAPSDLTAPQVKLRSNITQDELQLRFVAAAALEKLFAAAEKDDIILNIQSGFRSYELQQKLYDNYVKKQGQKVADTQSARAGYSEHQTGLAVDVGGESKPECNVESCFAGTPEGIWVANHAHDYGFTIRYPEDKMGVTGYKFEPWHLRFVGTELAAKLKPDAKSTLEEFFRLENAPDYE